jgi:3-deoxy-manno-octulosonate cytidylyltransferase (CMP-KDO synthetase)
VHAVASWAPTPLETAESLEQLRFLEHGVSIRMSEGRPVRVSVDTPEQAEIAQKFLLEKI